VRMVVASEFVSQDRVMEDPSWAFPSMGDPRENSGFDDLSSSDTLPLGRMPDHVDTTVSTI
jgi:hypothetical protein